MEGTAMTTWYEAARREQAELITHLRYAQEHIAAAAEILMPMQPELDAAFAALLEVPRAA
jgi:hypothetical protein